jgi:hypothetical protein
LIAGAMRKMVGGALLGKITTARSLIKKGLYSMKYRLQYLIPLVVLVPMMLAACSSGNGAQDAAVVVEEYLQAQVNKDANGMVNLSCSAWEEGALLEYESLAALTVTLEDLGCQVEAQDEQSAQVSCAGKMVFNYGTEVLEVSLADKTYRVVFEGGDWRMCGYQ